mgnify:CR=1 FL=1
MEFWSVLGFSAFVAIVLYYWYNPEVFKIHPEPKYPDNYAKHSDPYQYKKGNYR